MKINIKSILKKITKGGKNAVNKTLPILLQSIEDNTPEDTTELINSYKTSFSSNTNEIDGRITTTTPYAEYVEYGVGKVFNYQKPRGNKGRYVGVGARMFARGYEQARNQMIQSMKKNFSI